MLQYVKNFINGLVFGATQIVPGVSGSTIAIILGFYDELLESLNHFRDDWRRHARFLVPLLIGVAAGLVLFSSVIDYLLKGYSLPTMLFFIGLIVGIIPPVYAKIKLPGQKFSARDIVTVVVPALAVALTTYFKTEAVTDPGEIINSINAPFILFIFFAGIISAAALVTPGISGSFVLLLMGLYHTVTYSVSSVRFYLADVTDISLFLDICKVLVPFGIGVIIGGLSMARLIGRLLKNHCRIVYLVILGLLSGSIYVLFNEPIIVQSGITVAAVIIGTATFITGCVVSYKIGGKRL